MIQFRNDNYFNTDAKVLICTTNVVAIMGKGLAYEFKVRYPEMFQAYQDECRSGRFEPGTILPYKTRSSESDGYLEWIINFATKNHWKNPSKMIWIDTGLAELKQWLLCHETYETSPISIPPLGCGNGMLDYDLVKPKILAMCESVLKHRPNQEFYIYEPR